MPPQTDFVPIDKHLETYRDRWPARAFDSTRVGGSDELRDVTDSEEVARFSVAPAAAWSEGRPPVGGFGDGETKFLWVIRTDDMPYARESGSLGASIEGRKKLAHTNLTGGAAAHCGGELWFGSGTRIWLTGGSGRYPPRCKEELGHVESALRQAGYEVHSAGWSDELRGPARYFREEAA